MSCDKLVFDLSQEIEGSPQVFIKKDWLNILDNQNQNYNSNQSVLDTSQLANSNKYMSYREAYLAVPLLLTMLGPNTFTPVLTPSDYCMGLKSWFGQMIHSFTLDMQGTTVIQQTPFINMWNSFKLITSMSLGDIQTQGATIGFYPDDPLAWGLQMTGAANGNGNGVCNNVMGAGGYFLNATALAANVYEYGRGNGPATRRCQYINYNPAGQPGDAIYSTLLTPVACNQVWKSYISSAIDGAGGQSGILQISVMATIYLKHIHSFFSMCPLLKGVFMKMTMNLNNTTTALTVVGNGVASPNSLLTTMSVTSVSNPLGGVNPLMIASGAALQSGSANLHTGDYLANVSVGAVCLNGAMTSTVGMTQGTLARSIYLYIPAYTFNPIFEQAYLSAPIKTIKYTDLYQYQVLNITAGTNFNNLLTNGIANLKSVLLIPFFSSTATPVVNGVSVATGLPVGIPVYQSPFDPAGTGCTSPLVQLSNFNVVISGQNAIYNTQRYSFEQFNNQLYGKNAVNGGMTDGLTSGFINQLAFDMEYCYYYVDVSRMLPVEESVPKSVQIIGQNYSGKAIDLWCLLEYQVDISIDVLTGARV